MRNKSYYLIALLVLCAGCCHYRPVGVWTETVKCVRVIDGDTIEIEDGERVRLLGADAFEIRRGARLNAQAKAAGITPDEALTRGKQQAEALRNRIEGKTITLRFRLYPRDRYNRILGELTEQHRPSEEASR